MRTRQREEYHCFPFNTQTEQCRTESQFTLFGTALCWFISGPILKSSVDEVVFPSRGVSFSYHHNKSNTGLSVRGAVNTIRGLFRLSKIVQSLKSLWTVTNNYS